ncbi:ATP-binding protein [Flavobacterium sp.]|uniref:ATP-binding protein n=1 Tax=Flavobacterium sp. TaxID=239 RepID=UPI0038FC7937
MRKFIFSLLMIISLISYSQQEPNLSKYKTQKEKLQIWEDYCKKLIDDEKYKRLVTIANQGLILSKNDDSFLSKFYYYKAYGFEYDNNNYNDAVGCYESSWKYAKKSKQLKSETLAIMRLNYLYYSTKEFSKRDSLINYIKKILDTTKNIYTKGILNGSLGEYYLDKSSYEKFIFYKIKAIEYRKLFPKSDPNNNDNIGISYEQIAGGYIKMKHYQKGIEYTNYAKSYINNSSNATAFLYNNYIQCYVALKKIDSAQKYYRDIYNLVSKNDSLRLNISLANRSIAEYYLENNQIQKAYSYSKKALILAEKSNDEEILMEANMIMGKVLYKKRDYKNSIVTLNSASKFASSFDREYYADINKTLSKSYAALGLWQKAYIYNNIYSQSNDSIQMESSKQNIANAEAKYQNKTKQQKINILSTENTLKNLQIKNANRQRFFYISGILLITIIGFLIFYQSRNRKKTNEKLQLLNTELDLANKTKARFFSILNHDLRSPVSNLIHFLHIQKNNPELLDIESKKRMENKTIAGAENLLNSMEDILLWSKGQMESFKPQSKNITIHSIFDDTKKHFESEEKATIIFDNPEKIELITDENYLKTIIRNFTGNAIKALYKTDNPTIIWKAWQEKNEIFLSISDNGKGASNEQFKALYDETEVVGIKTGLGLHLIRDLAKAIDCEIKVESKLNQGTTFVLSFK